MTTAQQANITRLMRLATYASVSTAVILVAAKLVAWLATDSVSILATLIDSALDVLASLLNLIAVRHSLQPADHEHRFGHGKAESLAGIGQAMFIAGSAGLLLWQAVGRMLRPQSIVEGLELGVGVMLFSMLATLLLLAFQRYVISQTQSTAIKADALHYKTDLLVNGSVLIALVLTFYGWGRFDAVFAMGIALFILYSAWQIVKESIDLLMDHELPDDERAKIAAAILAHPKTQGFHELRTRRSGTTVFIQLHLELEETLSLIEAHQIADEVEQQLKLLFNNVEVIIHEDSVSSVSLSR